MIHYALPNLDVSLGFLIGEYDVLSAPLGSGTNPANLPPINDPPTLLFLVALVDLFIVLTTFFGAASFSLATSALLSSTGDVAGGLLPPPEITLAGASITFLITFAGDPPIIPSSHRCMGF